jgi:uncharacterized membrane protein
MSVFGDLIARYLDYNALKILHLFGVILFMGNIIVTGWWKTMADRTRDHRIVAFAQRQVTLTDWVFTFGGVTIALVSAFGMVSHMSPDIMAEIHATRWLWWGYYLLVASGVIWGAILIPLQIAQARMAHAFAQSGEIPPRYWLYGRLWLWFGILATIIPLANIYWMVTKA